MGSPFPGALGGQWSPEPSSGGWQEPWRDAVCAPATALLEGFDIRESTSFIEEHIDRQVRPRGPSLLQVPRPAPAEPCSPQVSPIESLRLMCLLSITENGECP